MLELVFLAAPTGVEDATAGRYEADAGKEINESCLATPNSLHVDVGVLLLNETLDGDITSVGAADQVYIREL